MFENLNINKKCKDDLTDAVENARLPHAVILEGGDREVRTLAAKELAAAILCQGEKKPCGKCRSCIKAAANSHPDIHFLQRDKQFSTIKVDDIRQLKAAASLLPNDSDKSVFIVSEAQEMNIAAQNALLKIFEEPAKHINFILTCASKSALLTTIISRGTSYSIKTQEAYITNDENFADAKEKASEFVSCLCEKSELDFILLTPPLQKNKELFSSILEYMTIIFRDALIESDNEKCLLSNENELAQKLCNRFSKKKIYLFIQKCQELLSDLNSALNYNLLLTEFASGFYF